MGRERVGCRLTTSVCRGSPFQQLFGKRTRAALGGIFEAEIVVDLEEGLVLPEFFEELAAVGACPEQAGGGAFDGVIGGAGRELAVGGPGAIGRRAPETGDIVISEKLIDAGLAAKCDGIRQGMQPNIPRL